MPSDTIDALRRVEVFKHLDLAKLREMVPFAAVHRFSRKQVIYMPSDPRSRLYAIITGRVKLTQLSPDGKELVLCVLGDNEVFGDLCLFDEGNSSTLATALEDAEVVTIKCSDLARFMAEDSELVASLAKHVGERLRALEQRLSDFVFKDVAQRLAGLLADMAHDYGRKESSGAHVVDMKITHQDLAGLIGSTRETTTTTLNQFREKGLIDFQRGRIIIQDLHRLERAANYRS